MKKVANGDGTYHLESEERDSRVYAICRDDEVLASIGQTGAFVIVGYPYRKTRDMYVSIKGANHIHCCNGDDEDIPVAKRGPSKASQRRFTRHVLSHHRRAKTLLKWFDGLKSLDGVIKRVVEAKE